MREIVFDTETTGFDPKTGDRIAEIGAIELVNHVPTGTNFHEYINPERDMPAGAFEVHGLSQEFLADKPVFADIAARFIEFIGEAKLVAHNAPFDMKFLNFELQQAGHEPIADTARVVDTLEIARRKFPAGPNSLDHLCTRFGVDNTRRTKHGALLDSELLAEVYIELLGGRQASLALGAQTAAAVVAGDAPLDGETKVPKGRPRALPSRLTGAEQAAHENFIAALSTRPVWRNYRT